MHSAFYWQNGTAIKNVLFFCFLSKNSLDHMARFIHKTADPGLRKSDKMWKGCSRKSTYSLLLLLAAQNVHHNSRINTTNRKLLCDIKSNYQQRQLCLFGRGLCSARGAWNKMSARLTDTGPFSSAVTVAVEWCEVVAVCLPPSVCRVWLDTARQNDASRFPTADRCVAAESAPETQTRHLRHATVSFPPDKCCGVECVSFSIQKESRRFSRFFFFF